MNFEEKEKVAIYPEFFLQTYIHITGIGHMVTSRAVINIFDSTVMLYEKLNFDMEGSLFFL